MVNGRLIKPVATGQIALSHDPTADFLDNDTIVLLAFAVVQAAWRTSA